MPEQQGYESPEAEVPEAEVPEAEVNAEAGGTNEVAQAAERLNGALGRLEALVEQRAAQEGNLNAELQRVRQENDQLKALLDQLAGRVDLAVTRLEEVLKE